MTKKDSKGREEAPVFSSERDPSILVVDDLQDNLDLMEALLQDEGFGALYFATSGSDALSLLEEVPAMALVLLDIMMPEMDGYEVCRRIRANPKTAHIPVIVVTGGAMRHDDALRKSYAAGATDFIQKPVNEIELYGRVQTALLLFGERMNSRRKAKELFESEMDEITRFAGNIARDFDSLLTLINACSTSILASKELPSGVGALAREIQGATEGAEKLSEQLTVFSQTSASDPRVIQLDGKATEKSASGRGKKKTILLVEDEPDLRKLTTVILSEQGYRVLSCDCGAKALKQWNQSGGDIDVLLSDVSLPDGITGPDLAQRLLTGNPDLRILFTSGYPLAAVSSAENMPRTFDFIQKPYTPGKLTHAIGKLLEV
ncbi:MAG: response regulator [Opitutales bacterium]